ncbi:MAG: polysaccharide deacetylase family protein [Lachnospiraceae bacterium]|nr:polysaccharide deacetylase family protein [Robinsoniella sp.]MDY3765421.1 polysaccharide deacetylase family protein [Lachnospiraceae bacterium]
MSGIGIKHLVLLHSARQTAASQEGNWGLSFQQEGAAPVGNASSEDLAPYHAAYVDQTDEKVIYLTFDAGYENGNTAPILDALKKHHVPATFFVVGTFLETSPDLVKRMAEEGHTVGNHTYHHPDMSKISSQESFRKELEDVEKLYQEITGESMSCFYRPPQGKYSTANLQMAKDMGYYTFFWSLAYVDWIQDDQPTKEEAFEKLLTRIHPGAIVLLHSTSSTNAAILDELLTRWEEMGYTFAPLSNLAEKLSAI